MPAASCCFLLTLLSSQMEEEEEELHGRGGGSGEKASYEPNDVKRPNSSVKKGNCVSPPFRDTSHALSPSATTTTSHYYYYLLAPTAKCEDQEEEVGRWEGAPMNTNLSLIFEVWKNKLEFSPGQFGLQTRLKRRGTFSLPATWWNFASGDDEGSELLLPSSTWMSGSSHSKSRWCVWRVSSLCHRIKKKEKENGGTQPNEHR